MATDLESVTVYMDPELKEGLMEWAKKERRSFSNLAAYLLMKAYEEYQEKQKK
ncbi:MAG: hypothetical protein AAGD25_10110 [Cyanobacteria bacterium P01_F01_bin.150]